MPSSVEESWLTPRAGIMLGVARTSRGNDLILFEFLRVEENGGAWLYRPRPRGQGEVDFKLAQAGEDYVEFTNPGMIFPSGSSTAA